MAEAAESPEARIAELQQKVQTARREIDELAAELVQVQERIDSLTQLGAELDTETKQRAAHIAEEVQAAMAELTADVASIEHEIETLQQSMQSQLDDMKNAAQATIGAFTSLGTHLGELRDTVTSEASNLVHRAAESGSKLDGLVQTFGSHVADTAESSMNDFHANVIQLEISSKQSFETLRQDVGSQLQAHVVDGVAQTNSHLQFMTEAFANQLQQHGQELGDKVQTTWQQFAAEQQERISRMTQEAESLAHAVEDVLNKMQEIGTSAVKSTDTVVDGVDALNIGFKVTIGTLDNVKSILGDIHL
jgi:DNA repair exonuclease SbcCD ATPase subunit